MLKEIIERIDKIFKENPKKMFFKRSITINNKKVSLYSYNYLNPFGWNRIEDPIKREIRGITIVNNEYVFPSIHKFFNIEEPLSKYNWNNLPKEVYIVEKIDGSLIIPFIVDDKVYFKTKNGFDNVHIKTVEKIVTDDFKEKIKELINQGYYPLFELVSPYLKIVIDYPETELYLIGVRYFDFNDKDFPIRYVNPEKLEEISKFLNIKTPEIQKITKGKLQKLQNEIKNKEGWVVYVDNELIKVKTFWYKNIHGEMIFKVDLKRIFQYILDEKIDDIYDNINEQIKDNIEKIIDIIMNRMNKDIEDLEKVREEFNKLDIKEFVKKYNNYTRYIKSFKEGKEPKEIMKEFYKKYIMKSNKQIQKYFKIPEELLI